MRITLKTLALFLFLCGLFALADAVEASDRAAWTMTKSVARVEIVTYDSMRELNAVCARYLGGSMTYRGCTVFVGGGCRMHVIAPRSARDYGRHETMGHELAHCFGARH